MTCPHCAPARPDTTPAQRALLRRMRRQVWWTVRDLAHRVGRDKTSIRMMLERLERAGMVVWAHDGLTKVWSSAVTAPHGGVPRA